MSAAKQPESAQRPPSTARRTQHERRSEAEARLILAAAELIAESGTAAVTLAAVGERAGYSRGIVGHHFGSKAALMARLVDTVHREFFQIWSDALASSESPTDQFNGLIDAFSQILRKLPPVHRAFVVLWADSAGAPPDARAAMAKSDRVFRSSIAEVLRAGQDAGEFDADRDIDALAIVIAGMLRGIAVQRVIDPRKVTIKRAFDEVRHVLAAAVGIQA